MGARVLCLVKESDNDKEDPVESDPPQPKVTGFREATSAYM